MRTTAHAAGACYQQTFPFVQKSLPFKRSFTAIDIPPSSREGTSRQLLSIFYLFFFSRLQFIRELADANVLASGVECIEPSTCHCAVVGLIAFVRP